MESLLQVVKKPSSLDAVAGEIKRQTLEAVKSKERPLYKHFTALCVEERLKSMTRTARRKLPLQAVPMKNQVTPRMPRTHQIYD